MALILLADDHALVRETIAAYLMNVGKHEVVCAATLEEALHACQRDSCFDLIILDLRMPGMEGYAGLRRMMERAAPIPVAIITGTSGEATVAAVRAVGAAGYLSKTLAPSQMLGAIQRMLDGQRVYPEADGEGPALTAREIEVLRGLAGGCSNKEIAVNLGLKEVTIKLHVGALSRKLGARNRAHAAILGREIGLI